MSTEPATDPPTVYDPPCIRCGKDFDEHMEMHSEADTCYLCDAARGFGEANEYKADDRDD